MLDYTGTQYLESCFQDLNYTPLMKCWFEIFYLIINESYLKFTKIVINNHFTVIDKITIVKKNRGKIMFRLRGNVGNTGALRGVGKF